ncbi:MAG: hypothetical protein MUD08_06820 [Cytophagales bacterium]|nr:hypothetical protein [Cytophagales bacterium]
MDTAYPKQYFLLIKPASGRASRRGVMPQSNRFRRFLAKTPVLVIILLRSVSKMALVLQTPIMSVAIPLRAFAGKNSFTQRREEKREGRKADNPTQPYD